MTDVGDPLAALHAVISEIIDLVQEVKQARWKASAPGALHAELDRLFEDVRSWARLLVETDEQRGDAPLASMPSGSSRTPPNLWPGTVTAGEVRHVIDEQLDRLARHVEKARSEQQDEHLRNALGDVERGVVAHRLALSAL